MDWAIDICSSEIPTYIFRHGAMVMGVEIGVEVVVREGRGEGT